MRVRWLIALGVLLGVAPMIMVAVAMRTRLRNGERKAR